MNAMSMDRTLAEPPGHYLVTRDGAQLRLRAVRPSDRQLLTDFFARLSPDDMHFRFLDAHSRLTPAEISRMTEVDHRRTEHVLAFDTSTGELIASLMLVADPTMETAELAIAVASAWKGRGIGWTMLRHAHDLAFLRGVKTLRCIESRAHGEAVEVERALGFHVRNVDADPALVLLEANVA